eukprot:TRINITY_DN45529_c0_g1_i1.p1 TRINITY_DN45529_c0_g1~~TRINITY_DN45529_c0_g1_i1.p1  ORF type:complete len:593 (+),score=91.45 TRINITY_DN45529_c0_g1_i1:90-1781(+)
MAGLKVFYACFMVAISMAGADPQIVFDDYDLVWAPAGTQEGISNKSLFDEISPYLGKGVGETLHARLPGFMSLLRPIWKSTPKNEFDRLGHAALRYTLNRLFVQRHGWFVNGLYELPGASKLNMSTVTDALLKYVPLDAQHVFERRISGIGLDENEAALLAATIESVIFSDTVEQLRRTYKFLGLKTKANLSREDFDGVMKIYMALRVTGLNIKLESNKHLFLSARRVMVRAMKMYPRWPDTEVYLLERSEELFPHKEVFFFNNSVSMVLDLEGRWARWSASRECEELSAKLLALEEGHNSGCVRLSDFYRRSFDPEDGWQFSENPDYLRQLGALQEVDPKNPRLVVSNYMNSYGNCVPSSKFYLACCISECESLQVQIESAVQVPDASPEDIVAVVQTMSSFTNNSVLSAQLRDRLSDIAAAHNGKVPLHSRLFSQWLHFVYPRECPYPQVLGKAKKVKMNYTSTEQTIDNVTLYEIVYAPTLPPSTAEGTCMLWQGEQEVFVPTFFPATTSLAALEHDATVWACMYFVGVLAIAVLMWGMFIFRLRRRRASREAPGLQMLV